MKNVIIDGVEYTPVVKEIKEVFLSLEQSLKFIIYPKDLGHMTWHEAIDACKALGEGWRLPTRAELLLIYENKEKPIFMKDEYYWSFVEFNNHAWIQNFDNGEQYHYTKTNKCNVRPVKSL